MKAILMQQMQQMQVPGVREASTGIRADPIAPLGPMDGLEPNMVALLEGMARGRASSAAQNERRLKLEVR